MPAFCKYNLKYNTYDTSFASRAGPISDRVVNPVALKYKKKQNILMSVCFD